MPKKTIDERLSEELGVDVPAVEQQLRFRLDHARMKRGEAGQLGYLFLDRQYYPDAAIVFDTTEEAEAALEEHPLIDDLCEEDRLDLYIVYGPKLERLAGREVILA